MDITAVNMWTWHRGFHILTTWFKCIWQEETRLHSSYFHREWETDIDWTGLLVESSTCTCTVHQILFPWQRSVCVCFFSSTWAPRPVCVSTIMLGLRRCHILTWQQCPARGLFCKPVPATLKTSSHPFSGSNTNRTPHPSRPAIKGCGF